MGPSLCQKNLKSRKRMTVLLPNEIIEATKMNPLNPRMIRGLGGQALERKEDLVKGDRDQDPVDEVAEGRDQEMRTEDMEGVGAEIEAGIEEEKEAGRGWRGRRNERSRKKHKKEKKHKKHKKNKKHRKHKKRKDDSDSSESSDEEKELERKLRKKALKSMKKQAEDSDEDSDEDSSD